MHPGGELEEHVAELARLLQGPERGTKQAEGGLDALGRNLVGQDLATRAPPRLPGQERLDVGRQRAGAGMWPVIRLQALAWKTKPGGVRSAQRLTVSTSGIA